MKSPEARRGFALMGRCETGSGEIHLQSGGRSHFRCERRQIHRERIVRRECGTGTVRRREVRVVLCPHRAFPRTAGDLRPIC